MAANTTPIFPLTPKIGHISTTSASTATDGTGSTDFFTAGTNGSRIDEIRIIPLGTCAASVARIFINNGAAIGTSTNNTLLHNITLLASTASDSVAVPEYTWQPTNLVLPATYKLTVSYGTAGAAGWNITAIGGDY